MKDIAGKLFLSSLFLLFTGLVYGQKVSFETLGPSLVTEGEIFRVEYSLDHAEPENFLEPAFDSFDVIAGPSFSTNQSISIVGSNMVQVINYTYTYVLRARQAGKFNIPAAEVTAGGKSYRSKALPIEVVSGDQAQGNTRQGSGGNGSQGTATTPADDDIVLRAIVNRTNVYRGQPVKVAYKLYTRLPLSGVENIKVPAFNGFWTQELDVSHYSWQRENYNSKIYESRVIREFLIYPQQAGTLTIESYDVNAAAQMVTQARRQSLFDDFFGGGPDIKEVRKKISSGQLKIVVNDLPANAPEGFTGAVGNFTMDVDYPLAELTANTSSAYVVKISGTGNLPLIQAPKFEMPGSFEPFNVKTTESLNRAGTGISGYRQFEYPFIPRAEGEYVLEPLNFIYFNPETARYVTLSTRELTLNILPDSLGRTATQGLVSGITKEDLKMLGQDIRFIKIGNPKLKSNGYMLMGSSLYVVIVILLVLLTTVTVLLLQKRMKEVADMETMKQRRANKVALSRLKAAENAMQQGDPVKFHDEMLRALWGYLSNKLNIPAANLTKENVRDGLARRGVPSEFIYRYIDLISDCEYAKYSPDNTSQMSEIFRNGVTMISKMESCIKK